MVLYSVPPLPPLQPIDYTSASFTDIFHLFPDLTSFSTITTQKAHSCEYILEVQGPPVAFRPRLLSLEKENALDNMLNDFTETKIHQTFM